MAKFLTVMTVMTMCAACGDPSAENAWLAANGHAFAGGPAVEMPGAAGSAAVMPVMPVQPMAAVDAGVPVMVPAADSGSPSEPVVPVTEADAGQAPPQGGSPAPVTQPVTPPPPTKPAPVEVALCSVSVPAQSYPAFFFNRTAGYGFSAGPPVVPYMGAFYAAPTASAQGDASNPVVVDVIATNANFATTTLNSGPDPGQLARTMQAIHDQQQVKLSWYLEDPTAGQTQIDGTYTAACAISKFDTITALRVQETLSYTTATGIVASYLFEARGYNAQ